MATEFLVLIAALLELKSRLMLPGAEDELEELGPEEAVEELLARMLEYRRYRDAAADAGRALRGASAATSTARRRCRRELRRVAVEAATAVYDPEQLGAALGDLLTEPPERRHQPHPPDGLAGAAAAARCATRSRGRASFDFDEAVRRRGPADPGGDRSSPCSSSTARARRPGSRASRFGPIEIAEGRETADAER